MNRNKRVVKQIVCMIALLGLTSCGWVKIDAGLFQAASAEGIGSSDCTFEGDMVNEVGTVKFTYCRLNNRNCYVAQSGDSVALSCE